MSSERFIPLSVPRIRGREAEYVNECLHSEWVSSAGPFVDRFEKEFAQYVGAKYAVACASGTAALHVSLLLAGVRPGDEVLVPSLTFIASVNTVAYCGAHPVFVGADDFYNISPSILGTFLRKETRREGGALVNARTGRRIAAVMPVHVFGNAVDLPPIVSLCEEFGLPIVEDAAESVGTRYRGVLGDRHTGTIGTIGCFSFNGNKIITTGGGGMIVTDSEELAEKAKYLTTQAKNDEVRFIHDEIGFNYRMTNVQAAIGVGQLEQVESFVKKKQEIYSYYRDQIEGLLGLRIGAVPPYARNNYWMIALQIDRAAYGESRDELLARLSSKNIQTRPVWLPNHRQRPFASCQEVGIESAERLWELTLNIPCSIGLDQPAMARVAAELRRG